MINTIESFNQSPILLPALNILLKYMWGKELMCQKSLLKFRRFAEHCHWTFILELADIPFKFQILNGIKQGRTYD
jgi:hypothetical protein